MRENIREVVFAAVPNLRKLQAKQCKKQKYTHIPMYSIYGRSPFPVISTSFPLSKKGLFLSPDPLLAMATLYCTVVVIVQQASIQPTNNSLPSFLAGLISCYGPRRSFGSLSLSSPPSILGQREKGRLRFP